MDDHGTPTQNGFWGEHKPQEQQGSGQGEGGQQPENHAAQGDILAALEQRWESVSQTLRSLRQENLQLREQTQQHEQRLAGSQTEIERLGRQVADLQQEKNQTISRIEALLARFNVTES